MDAIVAVDSNWGIGFNGNLLYRIKEDMSRFKARTKNHIVVMGRKTFESLPDQKPLKNRINIILTRQDITYDYDNVIVMHSVEEVLNYCKDKEAYCIGGAEIYNLFLPYLDKVYLTKIKQKTLNVDTYFPNLYNIPGWKVLYVTETKEDEENEVFYSFQVFKHAE
jgi:dihydrofolate reductase